MAVIPSSPKKLEGDTNKADVNQKKRRSFHVPASVLDFFLEDSTDSNSFSTDDSDDEHESLQSSTESQLLTHKLESREPLSTTRSQSPVCISSPSRSPLQHRQSSSHPLIHSCFRWLSSSDIDMNRLGLQRLMLLLNGRAINGHQLKSQATLLANVLVYGGSYRFSMEDRLRYAFCTLICDAPHEDVGIRQRPSGEFGKTSSSVANSDVLDFDLEAMMTGNSHDQGCGDSISYSESDASYSSEWDEPNDKRPQGKAFGVLHLQGLKVLAHVLAHIKHCVESNDETDDDSTHYSDEPTMFNHVALVKRQNYLSPIPLHNTMWRSTIQSIVHNIETNHNPDITGYSLRILRILQSIAPSMINPLVQHTLFWQLHYLREFGKGRIFPMICLEASRLLEAAESCSKRLFGLGL
jgi:hypothetical protein